MPPRHRTLAWPLALAYLGLVAYASLYPFSGWRDQGLAPLSFVTAPLPRYWTMFDAVANVLGYLPLGFLLTVAALRSGHVRRPAGLVLMATLICALVSLAMEGIQAYLPTRVPSNVDWALNTSGALVGAASALALERQGALARWHRFRQRWFSQDANGALVLLVLWPFGLLFPPAVPLSMGQVFERLEATLAEALDQTPFLEWLPVREFELQPLVPLAELACVALGVLVPVLLAFSAVTGLGRRLVAWACIVGGAMAVSALTAALSYGPEHAWSWLSLAVQVGLGLGAGVALLCVPAPRRLAAALALLAVGVHITLINHAPTSAYYAQALQTWEQGRFIRFHGLAQWIAWLWPFAAMVWLLGRVSRRSDS